MFPGTDFSQLVRMAKVGDHYQLHLAEAAQTSEQISFFEFLQSHFFSHENQDHGHDNDHSDLPLHTVDASVVFKVSIDIPLIQSIKKLVYSYLPAYQNDLHLVGFLSNVFLP